MAAPLADGHEKKKMAILSMFKGSPAPIAAEVDLKEVLNKWDNDEDGDSKECMQGAELEFFTDRIESPDVLPALEQLMDEVLGDCDEACATIEKMKKKVGA